ncbi:MAG: hypothetical protein AAB368_16090, partial [bacterium]
MRDAVRAGAGLVSFDPHWPDVSPRDPHIQPREIQFVGAHWITAGRPEDRLELPGALHLVARIPGRPIVTAGGRPLVTVDRLGSGRMVRWSRLGWANPAVLGPLGGLDGVLWRSLVWAARKPFVIRALPPLVALRVDDVAGTGERWNLPPLWWVDEAVRAGFRPWLGLFTHATSDAAVRELRPHLTAGRATAFPHALGRLRASRGPALAWDPATPKPRGAGPDGLGRTDAFIYYDHAGRRPWPDAEARARLDLAERWWRTRDLPMSRVFIPHWYEAGANTIPRVHDRWGAHLSSLVKTPESPCAAGTPWLRSGPFRRDGPPGPATPHGGAGGELGRRPVYYADTVRFAGRKFFNGLTEIRDIAGYEWTPDGRVGPTVDRGVRTIARGLDSLALAVLFTHETDHLWKIPPARLRAELRGVARGIAGRRPRFVTLDDGLRAVEATKTARIVSVVQHPTARRVTVTLAGRAAVETSFRLYVEGPRGPAGRTLSARCLVCVADARVRPGSRKRRAGASQRRRKFSSVG